ncbi:MAG: hypothetical protein ABIZ70_05790, partial [Gemmatimonadales bacterium]
MTDFRKARAVLRLALVSGVFWGVTAVVGRIGYDLLYAVLGEHPFAGMFSFPWLLTRFFLPGAIIGFAGGAIYAAAIALTPRAVG